MDEVDESWMLRRGVRVTEEEEKTVSPGLGLGLGPVLDLVLSLTVRTVSEGVWRRVGKYHVCLHIRLVRIIKKE